jgi:hypothetical protein
MSSLNAGRRTSTSDQADTLKSFSILRSSSTTQTIPQATACSCHHLPLPHRSSLCRSTTPVSPSLPKTPNRISLFHGLAPWQHLPWPLNADRSESASYVPAGNGEISPLFCVGVGQKAYWAGSTEPGQFRRQLWTRLSATVHLFFFYSVYFNSILNQVQTSKIRRNLYKFDKIINSIP